MEASVSVLSHLHHVDVPPVSSVLVVEVQSLLFAATSIVRIVALAVQLVAALHVNLQAAAKLAAIQVILIVADRTWNSSARRRMMLFAEVAQRSHNRIRLLVHATISAIRRLANASRLWIAIQKFLDIALTIVVAKLSFKVLLARFSRQVQTGRRIFRSPLRGSMILAGVYDYRFLLLPLLRLLFVELIIRYQGCVAGQNDGFFLTRLSDVIER